MIRHRPAVLLAVLCSPALLAGIVSGALIPSNIKSSSTPAAFRGQIVEAINKEMAALANGKPADQKMAREHLIAEAEGHDGVTATPEYQAEYATDIAAALVPLTDARRPLRVRLNAAVVAGRVAESVHGAGAADQFAKLSEALLKDKETAVVIWGMKTAKYAVGSMVQNGGNVSAFDKLIVNTVKTNRGSGPIVEEAYGALTLEPYQTSEQITKLTAAVLPDLLDLIQLRTEQYRSQDLPPSPLAEDKVDRFLPLAGFPAVKASAQTKNRTLKVMGEMTCAVLHTIADGNTSEDLIAIAREDGSAMLVFGEQLGDKTLSGAGQGIKDIPLNPASDQLRARCGGLADALKAMGVSIETPFAVDNGSSAGDNGQTSTEAPAVAGSGK